MRCPDCDATDNRVVDTRETRAGRAVRRRRECGICGGRFTTYEHIEDRDLLVVKNDGITETFDRNKLLRSMMLACAKRSVAQDNIDLAVDTIEDKITRSLTSEIEASQIGEMVMAALASLDRVAYVRFASVYRNFKDIGEFQEMLSDLNAQEQKELIAENQETLLL
jgi:transcriptional repressor NrdR